MAYGMPSDPARLSSSNPRCESDRDRRETMGKTTIEWTSTTLSNGRVVPGYTFNPWLRMHKSESGLHSLLRRKSDGYSVEASELGPVVIHAKEPAKPIGGYRYFGIERRRLRVNVAGCFVLLWQTFSIQRRSMNGGVIYSCSSSRRQISIGFCSLNGPNSELSTLASGRPSTRQPRGRYGSGSQPRIRHVLTRGRNI